MNTQHDITVSGKPLNPPKPPAKPHMLLWICLLYTSDAADE